MFVAQTKNLIDELTQEAPKATAKWEEHTKILPVVILTAHADPGVEKEAREAGASGFLAKGIGLSDLVIVLHDAAEPED